MSKQILVVAAHPDDEVLGCSGTIARHVSDGVKVYMVFMSDGVTSRTCVESNEVEVRKQAAKDASNILGIVQSPRFLGFPDNRMDTIALLEVVQALELVINKIKPKSMPPKCAKCATLSAGLLLNPAYNSSNP
jgi:LmbE family N-acetylglucosaminyl deacetylase